MKLNYNHLQFFGHLWMREVFVNNNTLDQHTVFHTSTNLGLNLNVIRYCKKYKWNCFKGNLILLNIINKSRWQIIAITHLDQLKVDVLGLEIGNSHDGIDGNVGHLVVTLVDDLAAQGGLGSTHQVLSILQILINQSLKQTFTVAKQNNVLHPNTFIEMLI